MVLLVWFCNEHRADLLSQLISFLMKGTAEVCKIYFRYNLCTWHSGHEAYG